MIRLSEYKSSEYLYRLRGNAPAGEGFGDFLTVSDGTRIFYQCWPTAAEDKPRIVMVCLHGMSGHGHYYSLAADHFAGHGYAVYAPDHRGHGLSGGLRGDIESGEMLITDVSEFVEFVASLHPDVPIFLMGESLGGLLSINYTAKNPGTLSGMIALAPALETAYLPGPREFVLAPYYGLCFAICPRSKVIIMSGREHRGIENNLHLAYHLNDPLVNRLITPRSLGELKKLIDFGRTKAPGMISTPTLILQGKKDTAVKHGGARRFYDKLVSNDKELKIYPDGGHNLISDPRAPGVLDTILEWIEDRNRGAN